MTPCLASAKTDVAPQHDSQSIDLIGFRQTLQVFAAANLLRDNNSMAGIAQPGRGFPQTVSGAADGRDGDRSSLTNRGKS